MINSPSENEKSTYPQRVTIAVAITILLLGLTGLFVYSFQVFLYIIGALLIALPLRAGARALHDKLGWKEGVSLIIIIILILALATGICWLFAARISEQVDQFKDQIPDALKSAEKQLGSSDIGRQILNSIPSKDDIAANSSEIMSQANGFLSSTFGALSSLYVIIFMGAFIVVNPKMYREGIIMLVPKSRRTRTGEILTNLNNTLVSWLLGQLFSMTVVGVLTFICLWILGVPLAGVLALLAGIVSFIPNLGPIIALFPALLFASLDGSDQVLYVLILYLAVQAFESSVATPMVQKKMINMPPALVFGSQLLIGAFGGLLGLTLATPIMAMVMVLVKMVYVQDILKDDDVEVNP
ncbi:MAG TPA: AI-2E family transporter [Dyadobacter sp.]|jgi:predicted PurR-regulated permease PerM|nr:AI-2E family transporter [Dyadobacter sp.]